MKQHKGFTLIEIAIVLLIVSILLGYTVAMAPRQQELKQFKQAKIQLNDIQDALYAFAQVNGYLPCPAWEDPNNSNSSNGFECRDGNSTEDGDCDIVNPDPQTESCDVWSGFVPAKTLGIVGNYNKDGLLQDPWNNPYQYHVTKSEDGGDGNPDFITPNDIQYVARNNGLDKLDPDLKVCSTVACATADKIIDKAPVIIWSTGKNREATTLQNENTDGDLVYISTAFSDNFDDLVKWVSPNILYSKMIEAGQLP